MMRRRLVLTAALALAAVVALPATRAQQWPKDQAQDNGEAAQATRRGPVFKAGFLNTEVAPSEWTLVLYPDGTGHFHADRANSTAPRPRTIEPVTVDREVKLSPEFTAWVFSTARANQFFNLQCQSTMKVAFQGWKTLSYNGLDGAGSCRFNYSKNKEIQELGESMVGVASTLMAGAQLELLRQHEPLGLDNEMDYIVEAAGDGRLLQIGAIQGTLQRLEADPDVMDRVKKQARKLLAKANRGQ